jgi:hypothetical protein
LVSAVTDQRQTRHRAEFDRQVETLVRLGYPQLMGMSQDAFVRHLTPLANMVTALPDGGGGRMPFILVPGEG